MNDHLVKVQGGRDYLMVSGRIKLFREDFPIDSDRPGRILTFRQETPDGHVSFRAEVYIGVTLVATGHASSHDGMNTRNFGGRVVEKIETSAIGRALGAAGYGTDKAFEDDEKDGDAPFYADSPVERSTPGKQQAASTKSQGQSAPATQGDSGASGERVTLLCSEAELFLNSKGTPQVKALSVDGEHYATGFTTQVFRDGGYDTSDWKKPDDPGTQHGYMLIPPALVVCERKGKFLNIVEVMQAADEEAA